MSDRLRTCVGARSARAYWSLLCAVMCVIYAGPAHAADFKARRIEVAGAIRARFIEEGASVIGVTEENGFFFVDLKANGRAAIVPPATRSYDPLWKLRSGSDWLVDEDHDLTCVLDSASHALTVMRLSTREQKVVTTPGGIKWAHAFMPSGEILFTEKERLDQEWVTPLRTMKIEAGEVNCADLELLDGFLVAGPDGPSLTYVTADARMCEVVRMLPRRAVLGTLRAEAGHGRPAYFLSPHGDELVIQTSATLTCYELGDSVRLNSVIDLNATLANLQPRPVVLPAALERNYENNPAARAELDKRARESPLIGVCFSPEGPTIAVPIVSGEILMLNSHTGEELATLDSGPEASGWADFDPSGLYLGRAGYKHGVEVWSVKSKSIVATVPFTSEGLRAPTGAFSADGSKLLAVEPGIAVHILEGWRE